MSLSNHNMIGQGHLLHVMFLLLDHLCILSSHHRSLYSLQSPHHLCILSRVIIYVFSPVIRWSRLLAEEEEETKSYIQACHPLLFTYFTTNQYAVCENYNLKIWNTSNHLMCRHWNNQSEPVVSLVPCIIYYVLCMYKILAVYNIFISYNGYSWVLGLFCCKLTFIPHIF